MFFLLNTHNPIIIPRQTHTRTHFCLHTVANEGEQPSVFEHEWADVVVASHAWVRLYSTWLQYPTGFQMGSNTLTQLSDQINWVWDCVYARVWRRMRLEVCIKSCPLLPFYSTVHVWLCLSPCLFCAPSCTCNDCIRQPPSLRARLTFAPTCLLKFMHFSPTRKEKRHMLFLWKLLAEDHAHLQPSDPVSALTSAHLGCRGTLCIIHKNKNI